MELSSSETAAQRIERAITRKEFRVGMRMPSERALAERFGISRSALREGIGMLVAKGVLRRRQGDGTYVNDVTARQTAEVWSNARRDPQLQGHLLDFRHMLERQIAELAAERHTAEDRVLLEAAGEAVETAFKGSDRRRLVEADIAFHKAIADATHNPVVSSLMSSLQAMLYEHMQLSLAGSTNGSSNLDHASVQHRELLDAILKRNPAAAARVASDHIELVRVHFNNMRRSRPQSRS